MSSINSKADIIVSLRGLIDAGDRSPELQQGIATERQALEETTTEIETLKGRQEELTGLRQETTQLLNAAIARGKDAAIRYRAVVRAKIGPRNERLVQFGMVPIRRRPRKPPVVVKPPDGETDGTEPGAPASPFAKPVV